MNSKLYKNPQIVQSRLQGDCNGILKQCEHLFEKERHENHTTCTLNVDAVLQDLNVYTAAPITHCSVIPKEQEKDTSRGFIQNIFFT